MNTNPLMKLFELFSEKKWNYLELSSNPYLTWDIMLDINKKYQNTDKLWNIYKLSKNPNITWGIIKNNNFPWDWKGISKNPNITWEIVKNNLDKPWNFYELIKSKKFIEEMVNELNDKNEIELIDIWNKLRNI